MSPAAPRATRPGHGRTWAKAILLGEHSVVYGHPAVALPLHDLEMTATVTPTAGPSWLHSLGYDGPLREGGPRFACIARALEAAREFSGLLGQSFRIETRSDFPHERGLGSSAAAAGAIIRAVLDSCGRSATMEELLALTHMAEQVAHDRPSGLDAAATSAPAPIRFQSGEMRPLAQRIAGGHIVIADSGVHGSTREAVRGLRLRYEASPAVLGPKLQHLGDLTTTATHALDTGDAPLLGAAMNEAHTTLGELGLSLPVLDRLTDAARGAGALGAKLTGGGLGGCVIALAAGAEPAARVRQALDDVGARRTWIYRMRTSQTARNAS
ncbi:mevalonate kinase [Actinomyces sp. MRS3W]|uniref:mevalonate kinase n=1 Tax=Actinomyces sp. MRS3W TaxID=2800796 RepID=UPI0028FD4E57|nr:mevalonate kinase [Actinomyces sp. MRS3W]MDU0348059.1 mevalonate kinase [Actinomyces sp. MRS3W]